MEGKLFIVYPNEINSEEKFEEITTPIRELVDKEPFSLWFNPNYFFNGDKKY